MSASEPVVVIGAGGHSKVVVATLRAAGHEKIQVFDDDPATHGTSIVEAQVVGPVELLRGEPRRAILAIGDNRIRARLGEELDLQWLTVIHPAAWVDPATSLADGSVVFAGAVVQVDCVLGRHVIVNTGATIDHDCRIGDWAHIAPGSNIAGDVEIGQGALVGLGCAVLPGRSVGSWAVVGGGGVVAEDVPAEAKVAGVPARAL